jgi:DNA-binding transcriptional LysR family regulator
VRELEEHLGAPLFERGASGVALTAVGVRFLDDAERALDHLGRAAEIAGAVGREERQVLRIGAAPIPGSGFLPEALQAIAGSRPQCRIRLHEASSADNLIAIRAGALDLAVVLGASQMIAGAEVLPLWQEGLMSAVPPTGRLADRSAASWRDVGPDGLILPSGEIGEIILQRLAGVFGRAFAGAACRAGPETALRLAAMGQGTAIVPAGASSLAPEGLCLRPIADNGILVSAVRLVRNEKPALRRLMRLLRDMATPRLRDRGDEPASVVEMKDACLRRKPASAFRGAGRSGVSARSGRVAGVSASGAPLSAAE